jgi:hypothetical protein
VGTEQVLNDDTGPKIRQPHFFTHTNLPQARA